MTGSRVMEHFLLLGTEGCHLCDQAEAILVAGLNPQVHSLDAMDIAYDDLMLEKYGERIPVLLHEVSGSELYWPFNEAELIAFIERCK